MELILTAFVPSLPTSSRPSAPSLAFASFLPHGHVFYTLSLLLGSFFSLENDPRTKIHPIWVLWSICLRSGSWGYGESNWRVLFGEKHAQTSSTGWNIQGPLGTWKITKLLTKITRFPRVKYGRSVRPSVNVLAKRAKRTCEVYSYFQPEWCCSAA